MNLDKFKYIENVPYDKTYEDLEHFVITFFQKLRLRSHEKSAKKLVGFVIFVTSPNLQLKNGNLPQKKTKK